MKELIERYLQHLAARGLRRGTIALNRRTLLQLCGWLASREKHNFRVVVPDDLCRYQAVLPASRLTSSTIAARLGQVRCFFQWLTREGVLSSDPSTRLSTLVSRRRLPANVLTEEEAAALIESADKSQLGLRDRAILELLYSSGLRVSELVELNLSDLDLQQGIVLVRSGKGGKE